MEKNCPCPFYQAWRDMEPGLPIAECVEIYKGLCGETLSPHDGDACPWGGYPLGPDDGEGRWKAPEARLVENVAKLDNQVED